MIAREAGVPVVDIEHLSIAFATDAGDVTAVDDVSLTVDSGEVLAVVGESGSGKTVTAKSIIGLLPETAVTGSSSASSSTQATSPTASSSDWQSTRWPGVTRPWRAHALAADR